MLTGQNVTIAWVGDSGLEGTTVVTPGNDCASRVSAVLGTRFGITVTKSNRAVSGYCAYWALNPSLASPTKFAQALADAADLYVISFGHNDIRSGPSLGAAYLPGTGYPVASSMAAVEHMVRRIRTDVPKADIVLSNEWPYTGTAVGSNTDLVVHAAALRRLAMDYGCGFIDYTAALAAVGVTGSTPAVDDLYIGSVVAQHPNDEGHRIWAEAIEALFPAGVKQRPVPPPIVSTPLYGAERFHNVGWQPIAAAGARTALTPGYTLVGSWAGLNTLPLTTSTANDAINIQFCGSELAVRIDTGSGHIKVQVDGVTYNADLNLAALGSAQAWLPISVGPGIHSVVITVLSGSVTFRGWDYLPSAGQVIPYTSALLTYTGTWITAGVSYSYYASNAKQTTTPNDTVTVEWVGTALALNGTRYAAVNSVGVATDGGTEAVVDRNLGTGITTQGSWLVTSGLPYGRHTTVIRQVSAGRALVVSAFLAYDETRTDRPNTLEGVTVTGETVTHPVALPGRPTVRLSADDATSAVPGYATTPTAAGFTAAGTGAARHLFSLTTGRIAY